MQTYNIHTIQIAAMAANNGVDPETQITYDGFLFSSAMFGNLVFNDMVVPLQGQPGSVLQLTEVLPIVQVMRPCFAD